tara:strand:+ start:320 stop:925 length:606 start_codon:yes stop_codon:yes gene_type:complete
VRITKEQSEENRDRILDAASKLFLEHGFDGIGVADLMRAAGFTHGGFYNHFRSKDDLAAESAQRAFEVRAGTMAVPEDLKAHIELYLSPLHLDNPKHGCPAAALAGDAARQSELVKGQFATGVERMIQALETRLGDRGEKKSSARRFKAINLLTKLVGAIAVARAMPEGSDIRIEILETALGGALQDAGISKTRRSQKSGK